LSQKAKDEERGNGTFDIVALYRKSTSLLD
jgi:hypothetical protein